MSISECHRVSRTPPNRSSTSSTQSFAVLLFNSNTLILICFQFPRGTQNTLPPNLLPSSDNGLVINTAKCVFAVSSLEFLSYQVTAAGLIPLPRHVDAIQHFSQLQNVKKLQGFFGLVNFKDVPTRHFRRSPAASRHVNRQPLNAQLVPNSEHCF